jgi:NAD(P)-dependent dehydrogenase (short-subunit alcohol dehydrogenase family)
MTRLTTPFSARSTASEVLAGIDLAGRRAIVTGGASGIGIETARALAAAGAAVTLAVRRPAEADAVDLRTKTGQPAVQVRPLDLADPASIRAFAAGWQEPLHILVNNAGIMALPELQRTAQGHELQFATNFLGHYALTLALRDAMVAANGARVVCLSSSAHMWAPVFFDDPGFAFIPYTPFVAYGQSKTACALLALGITQRWDSDGILANAVNPGAIPTGLQRHTGGTQTPPERRKTPAQGAATSVLLAASPLLDGIGGRYFEDCAEALPVTARPTDFSGGVAPYALNEANAQRLWDLAFDLVR